MQHFGPNIVGPAASGKFPVVRCRGADSRARHSTNDLYQLPLKWKKLSTCHCEGALRPWQSREGTCSLYKLLLKRCAPIASVAALSERHAGQQHVAHGFCGVTPPELSLRGRFAPVAISQYLAGLWESCRRNRNCLHEISTSASGLLAMTNLWPSLFYRQPVRIGSNAPGPAVRSPTKRSKNPQRLAAGFGLGLTDEFLAAFRAADTQLTAVLRDPDGLPA